MERTKGVLCRISLIHLCCILIKKKPLNGFMQSGSNCPRRTPSTALLDLKYYILRIFARGRITPVPAV